MPILTAPTGGSERFLNRNGERSAIEHLYGS